MFSKGVPLFSKGIAQVKQEQKVVTSSPQQTAVRLDAERKLQLAGISSGYLAVSAPPGSIRIQPLIEGQTLLTVPSASEQVTAEASNQAPPTFDTLDADSIMETMRSNSVASNQSSHFGDLFDATAGDVSEFNVSNSIRLSPSTFQLNENSNDDAADELLNAVAGGDGSVSTATATALEKHRGKGRPAKSGSPGRGAGVHCQVCQKSFNNSSALAKHKLTHSDERKYVCVICSKAFKRQDHLNGHMMTHRSKKPFECKFDGCDKSYCDARSLRRHLENHHNQPVDNGDPRPFFSFDAQSGYSYTNGGGEAARSPGYVGQMSPLSPHASPHHPTSPMQQAPSAQAPTQQLPQPQRATYPFDEPKPIPCSLCHRRFRNIPALNGHMRLHGGYFKKDMNPQVQAKQQQEAQKQQQQQQQQPQKVLPLAPPPPPKNKTKVSPGQQHQQQQQQTSLQPQQQQQPGFVALKHMVQLHQTVEQTMRPTVTSAPQPIAPTPGAAGFHGGFAAPGNKTAGGNLLTVSPPQAVQVAQQMLSSPENTQIIGQLLLSTTSQSQAASVNPIHVDHSSYYIPDNKHSTYQQQHQQQLHQQPRQQYTPQQQQQQHMAPYQQHSIPMSPHGSIHSDAAHNSPDPRSLPGTPSYSQGTPSHPLTPSHNAGGAAPGQMFTFPPRAQDLEAHHVALNQQHHNAVTSPHMVQSPHLQPHHQPIHQQLPQQQQLPEQLPQLHATYPTAVAQVASLEQQLGLTSQMDVLGSSVSLGRQDTVPYSQGQPTLDDIQDLMEKAQPNIFFGDEELKADHLTLPDPDIFKPSLGMDNSLSSCKRRSSADPDRFTQPKRPLLDKVSALAKDALNTAANSARPVHNHGSSVVARDTAAPPTSEVTLYRLQGCTQPADLCASWPGAPSDPRVDSAAGKSSAATASNHSGLFRNPPVPPAAPAPAARKKHRPEPLVIPPHVNNSFGFASRLRSPRLWPSDLSQRTTPPPYTPPPMLSPVRSGSGLFWSINQHPFAATPLSAPITPKRFARRPSMTLTLSAEVAPPAVPPLPLPEVPEVMEEVEIQEPPPETDILPHVNIGPHYQAEIPHINPNRLDALLEPEHADVIWSPGVFKSVSEEEVQYFQDFACSAALPGSGTNKEYALHLLHLSQGNIKKAMLLIMQGRPAIAVSSALFSFQYVESDTWTSAEIDNYQQALLRFDKDFFNIAKEVGNKSVKQCIQFYYLWKKVCSEDYKRMRSVRRKREQEELYNLRNREHNGTLSGNSVSPGKLSSDESAEPFRCSYSGCGAAFNSRQALNGHVRVHGASRESSPRPASRTTPTASPASSPAGRTEDGDEEEFPCRICGKVFNKVKSRSAHMKSHRHIDNPVAEQPVAAHQMASEQQRTLTFGSTYLG